VLILLLNLWRYQAEHLDFRRDCVNEFNEFCESDAWFSSDVYKFHCAGAEPIPDYPSGLGSVEWLSSVQLRPVVTQDGGDDMTSIATGVRRIGDIDEESNARFPAGFTR
jgi:hypothetical protein